MQSTAPYKHALFTHPLLLSTMGEADVKTSLSQILLLLDDKGTTPKSKLDGLNKILESAKQVDDISKFVPVTSFLRCMRSCLVHYSKTMHTASLRILRYYLPKGPAGTAYIKEMISLRMHYFITRSLERDKHSEAERIQALKLVRAIMEAECSLIPPPIIQALVASAENQEDTFCRVCLETLCEIAIRNPQVVALCNGMRILFDSILDPFYQGIQESLVVAILYLLNDQHTRIYIRPRADLQIILSPLTNTFNMGPLKNATKEKEKEKEKEDEMNMKKWLACCKAIVTLLKSWTGIIFLASDAQGLRSLVDALKMPFIDLHEKVLDVLFEIFRLSQPKLKNDPFRYEQNTNVSIDTSSSLDLPSRTRAMRHNLLNNYIAMLLLAFMDCGLIEGLIQLSSNLPRASSEAEKERSRIITQKSTILLGELLHLSNTFLPPSQCAKLQTLPALVNRAISFAIDPRIRSRASTMATNLHAYSHIKASSSYSDFDLSLIVTGANKWRRIKGKDRRLDKIDEVKMKMDWSLDDAQLLQKIKDSNVPLTKDNMKWHWEIISELLSGALLNPAHLAKALNTKFIKRILSFLRPSNRLFSTMAWTADSIYVRTACQVLELLVSQEIGFEYLKDNKFITSMAEMLRIEIEASLQESDQKLPKLDRYTNRLLSSEKLLKTMSCEYFAMLGTLSSTQLGLEIMERNKLFDHLKPMSELPHRDDLSKLIMRSLDYNIDGEPRAILAKTLTSNSKVMRFLATRHMRLLLRAGVSMYHEWGVTLLVQQLNDSDPRVTQAALSVLDEACDEPTCLEAVIKLNPPLLKHGKPGKDLMLRFMSSNNGLKLLKELDFIKSEMQLWKDVENVAYLQSIEASLMETLSLWRQREGADQSNYGVYLPPHFYGELTKSAEGCEILRKSKHFDHILATAFDNNTSPLHQRAALIAMGHIGSSPTGFTFLEESRAVFRIVNICENSSCLTMRGVCFYVLGMISRIERSREILDQCGWESPVELHTCISVPKNIHTNPFLKVPPYEHCGSAPVPEAAGEGLDDIGKEVLGYIGKLSNHITADSASRSLKRMRAKNPEHFTSAVMLHYVFQLMAGYKFRLGVRRFIYDCFDGAIFSEDLFSRWDSEPSFVVHDHFSK